MGSSLLATGTRVTVPAVTALAVTTSPAPRRRRRRRRLETDSPSVSAPVSSPGAARAARRRGRRDVALVVPLPWLSPTAASTATATASTADGAHVLGGAVGRRISPWPASRRGVAGRGHVVEASVASASAEVDTMSAAVSSTAGARPGPAPERWPGGGAGDRLSLKSMDRPGPRAGATRRRRVQQPRLRPPRRPRRSAGAGRSCRARAGRGRRAGPVVFLGRLGALADP